MSSSDSKKTTDSSKSAEEQPGYYESAKQYASSGAQYASDTVGAGTGYVGKKYEEALPWLEDKYLQYFTNDNKASYATKGTIRALGVNVSKEKDTNMFALS